MGFMSSLRELLPNAEPLIVSGGGPTPPQESLRGDLGLVRRAVAAAPNTNEHFETRDAFLKFGYAIKAALPDQPEEALNLFLEWADRWTGGNNDPEWVKKEWRRYKGPYRVGIGYLCETAEKASGGAFTAAERWFDAKAAAAAASSSARTSHEQPWPEPIDLFSDTDPAELAEPPAGSLPGVIDRWSRTEARRKGVPRIFAAAS